MGKIMVITVFGIIFGLDDWGLGHGLAPFPDKRFSLCWVRDAFFQTALQNSTFGLEGFKLVFGNVDSFPRCRIDAFSRIAGTCVTRSATATFNAPYIARVAAKNVSQSHRI
jgi:hypothetical protein